MDDKTVRKIVEVVTMGTVLGIVGFLFFWHCRTEMFIKHGYTRQALIGHDGVQWVLVDPNN